MTEKQIQLEANNKLYHEGWTYWYPPEMFFSYNGANVIRDIFGVFDLIAIKDHHRPRFIQLTSKQHISDRVKKVEGFYSLIGFRLNGGEVWGYDPKKGEFKIIKL